MLCYGKRSADGTNTVLVAVNLDPFAAHEARVRLPLDALGIATDESFQATELIAGERHLWWGGTQHLRLDPRTEPAAIFHLERFGQRAYGTPCY
jgi:starch synthase (maltosyl-transferring)